MRVHGNEKRAETFDLEPPKALGIEVIEIEPCDQYTVQGDLFSQSILENKELPVPLEESIKNMAVIEAISRSAKSGKWEAPFSPGL